MFSGPPTGGLAVVVGRGVAEGDVLLVGSGVGDMVAVGRGVTVEGGVDGLGVPEGV